MSNRGMLLLLTTIIPGLGAQPSAHGACSQSVAFIYFQNGQPSIVLTATMNNSAVLEPDRANCQLLNLPKFDTESTVLQKESACCSVA